VAAPKIDCEKVARILVSAVEIGNDGKAAEHWKIAPRTLRNYRKRLESDPELAAAFEKFSRLTNARIETERLQLELGWRKECHATLRTMLEAERAIAGRMLALVEKCDDIELLAKVSERLSRSTERIGQLDVATEALGVGGTNHPVGTSTPAATTAAEGGGAEIG